MKSFGWSGWACLMAPVFCFAPTASAQEGEGEGEDVSDLPSSERHDRYQIVSIDRVWTAARRRRDQSAERAADRRLNEWLAEELEEAERALEAAKEEAEASRDEASGSGRPRDHRHARQENRDENLQQADLDRLVRLIRELKELQPRFDRGNATPRQYNRKQLILRDLVRLARADSRDSRSEQREETVGPGHGRRGPLR